MNKITWSIFIAISVSLLALLVGLSSSSKIDVSKVDVTKIQSASIQNGQIGDHVYGNPNSKIILIEYGDFQCPACGTQYPITKALIEDYKDYIQLVFRNLPLTEIHPNAKLAAAAAEAAGLQNKFWEMHDKLYEKQSDWDSSVGNDRIDAMAKLAKSLNLDVEKFTKDMGTSAVLAKINYDQALTSKLEIKGTPTFYLNGKLLNGDTWSDLDKFKTQINNTLKEANITPPTTQE